MDIHLQQADGSTLELSGCFLIDYDINSMYASPAPVTLKYNAFTFTPSIYSRQGPVLTIEGPWAVDVDMERAMVWAKEQDVAVFPVTAVGDDGKGEVFLHFTTDHDAIVAMLALA